MVDATIANWQLVQDLFGPDRILRTIEPGPTHALPAEIYAAMERVKGS